MALRRAIEFDRVVGELAASLLRVPVDAIDAQIVQTLGTVGELLGADRASVVQYVPAQQMVMQYPSVGAGGHGWASDV